MLFRAPYDVLEKKVKTTFKGTRRGLHRRSTLVVSSDDETDPSAAEDNNEEGGTPPCERKVEKGGLPEFGGGGAQEGERLLRG